LTLAAIVPDAAHAPGLETSLTRELTLDLFEPPQRERVGGDAVRLEARGLGRREIARRLPGKSPSRWSSTRWRWSG
jgi:hypothetical protein